MSKRLKHTVSRVKKTQKYTDPAAFEATLDQIMADICAKHEKLLQNTNWTLSADAREQLFLVHENLARRFMHRCSLFAMHRTNTKPETMKKAKVALTEDDVNMAWQTLQMDEQHK